MVIAAPTVVWPGTQMSQKMPGKIIAYTVRPATFVARQGSRGRWVPAGLAGRSVVTSASSAYVRDAYTWPTRASNSSWVSRPCTNAVFSVPITRSRSAWEARRRHRPAAPAAISSPGPSITGTSPRARWVKRNAAALGRLFFAGSYIGYWAGQVLDSLSRGLDELCHFIGVGDHRHVAARELDDGRAHAAGELELGVGRDGLIVLGDQEPGRV